MRNFSGNNRSERGKDFSKRGSRDSGRPSMHQATCSNCGKDCEVPFKPTSGKPIFCSNCFDKSQNDGPKKYGKERSDRKFKSEDSRKRSFDYSNSSADNKGKENDQLKKEIVTNPIEGVVMYDRPGWDTIQITDPGISSVAYISTMEMAIKARVKFD